MNDLRLKLGIWTAHHGWWPWLAALMVGATALTHGLLLPGLQEEQRKALARHDHAVRALQASLTHEDLAPPPPEPLTQFKAQLADAQTRSSLIERMWQDAARLKLNLTKIEFKEEPGAAGAYVMLHIRADVNGDYPSIKRYAFNLMKRYPALTLDALEFQREAAAQSALAAPLHFTLLMRP